MSGWTYITVEVAESTEEETLDDGVVAQCRGIAGELADADSAEEQAKLLEELQQLAEHNLKHIGEIDSEEHVRNWLKRWSSDFFKKRDDTLMGDRMPTVQYPSKGSPCTDAAKEILTGCAYAERVLIITANDITDSGKGWLYELDDGDVTVVEEWEGYEGAVGSDVRGYFKEEYGISSRAR